MSDFRVGYRVHWEGDPSWMVRRVDEVLDDAFGGGKDGLQLRDLPGPVDARECEVIFRHEDACVVSRQPFVPNTELIRKTLAKYGWSSPSQETCENVGTSLPARPCQFNKGHPGACSFTRGVPTTSEEKDHG